MNLHKPVLLKEVLQFWHSKPGGHYIDGTLGLGGHALGLLKMDPHLKCLGMDCDQNAISLATESLQNFKDRTFIFNDSYLHLPEVMKKNGWDKTDGILLDLGVSSLQLDDPSRGFSLKKSGPLDMRMDPTLKLTALDLIKNLSQQELAGVILKFGEERFAKEIAFNLKRAVAQIPDLDTNACAEIIKNCIPQQFTYKKIIHPATKTFQALRIAVNHELENLRIFLDSVPDLIEKGGRLVLISFHSLEDRLIKEKALYWQKNCICPPSFPKCVCSKESLFKLLTKKPITASPLEINENPRSRSAKLRVLEKC